MTLGTRANSHLTGSAQVMGSSGRIESLTEIEKSCGEAAFLGRVVYFGACLWELQIWQSHLVMSSRIDMRIPNLPRQVSLEGYG